MEDRLQHYIDQSLPDPELTIHYHIGDSFSGETELLLHGDGRYQLWSTATHGRLRRSYNGAIAIDQVQGLVRALLASRFWDARHVHPRPGDDDPEARIVLTTGGEQLQAALWVSEIRKLPVFVQAQAALLTIIRDISHGTILESGQ